MTGRLLFLIVTLVIEAAIGPYAVAAQPSQDIYLTCTDTAKQFQPLRYLIKIRASKAAALYSLAGYRGDKPFPVCRGTGEKCSSSITADYYTFTAFTPGDRALDLAPNRWSISFDRHTGEFRLLESGPAFSGPNSPPEIDGTCAIKHLDPRPLKPATRF